MSMYIYNNIHTFIVHHEHYMLLENELTRYQERTSTIVGLPLRAGTANVIFVTNNGTNFA